MWGASEEVQRPCKTLVATQAGGRSRTPLLAGQLSIARHVQCAPAAVKREHQPQARCPPQEGTHFCDDVVSARHRTTCMHAPAPWTDAFTDQEDGPRRASASIDKQQSTTLSCPRPSSKVQRFATAGQTCIAPFSQPECPHRDDNSESRRTSGKSSRRRVVFTPSRVEEASGRRDEHTRG